MGSIPAPQKFPSFFSVGDRVTTPALTPGTVGGKVGSNMVVKWDDQTRVSAPSAVIHFDRSNIPHPCPPRLRNEKKGACESRMESDQCKALFTSYQDSNSAMAHSGNGQVLNVSS